MDPDLSSAEHLAAVFTALHREADRAHRAGWTYRLQQLAWFEILAGIAPLQNCSVLDAGCGLGDLYEFLQSRGFCGDYTGVDLVETSIAAARARYPEAHWICGDLLDAAVPPHDYVFASGLLDVRTPDSPTRIRATLTRAFELCRRGLAWNMYSILPDERPERMYIEPLAGLLEFCDTLTPWCVLRRDYAPGHFTMYLYRRAHFLTPGLQAAIGRLYLDTQFGQALRDDPEEVARAYGVTLQQLELLESLL